MAHVIEELMPKARVEQVADCMFAAAEIEVHTLPVVDLILSCEFLVIMRVHIAQEVPA